MQLGPYTIIDRLGIGGSGEILRAYQNTDPKKEVVVLKRLLHKLKNDLVAQEYFETEADLGRQLVHPNLVRQLRVGLHEEELFLVLEYIDGPDLSALLKKTRVLGLAFPVTLGLYILQQILDGLHYAHELKSSDGDNLNLVHRDVNPHNVLLSQDGRVVLADFGVARLQSLEGGRPEEMAYGKLGYISPEQLHNRPIDRRTDIFALGVLAYEMFVGLHPFVKPDDNDDQVTKRILENDYPPIALAYPELQKPIADSLIKALETKTKKRFQTALEMRDRISDFIPPHFNGPETLQKTIKKLFS